MYPLVSGFVVGMFDGEMLENPELAATGTAPIANPGTEVAEIAALSP
jgi:hypothetical protein